MQQPFRDQSPNEVHSNARSVVIRPRELWRGCVRGAVCYILCSPLLFSVNPLPLALICAADGQLTWMLAGTALGAWQWGGASRWTLAAATLAILLRLLLRLLYENNGERVGDRLRRIVQQSVATVRDLLRGEPLQGGRKDARLFDDGIPRRILVSLACALFCAFGVSLSGGFAFYDLYGSVFYLLLTPPLTALFSHLRPVASKKSSADKRCQIKGIGPVARAVLVGCTCFCGRPLRFLGLSLVLILSVWICLEGTRRCGLGAGMLWALVCGCSYDPFTAPLLIGICLVYALLRDVIGAFSLLIASLGGAVYLLLFAKDATLWTLLPSLVVGISLFSVHCRLTERSQAQKKPRGTSENAPKRDESAARIIVAEQNHAQTLRTISAISAAFSSLAEAFRSTKPPPRPSLQQATQLCEQTLQQYCSHCSRKAICPRRDGTQSRAVLHAVGERLRERGEIAPNDGETLFFRECPEGDELIQSINDLFARACYDLSNHDVGELFSMHYNGISHLLRDVLHQERDLCDEIHPDLSESILQYLRKGGMPARQVTVYGTDRLNVRISGLSLAALTISQEQFRLDIAKILGAPASKLQYSSADEGILTFHTLPAWQVRCRYRSMSAAIGTSKSRQPCGDTIRTFEDADGRFYALLCDGMGHGPKAAAISGVCAVFLERTLRAGVSAPTALSLLNQYLVARSRTPEQEISSTVDLFCLERYTGKGLLVKSGAAPTWLLKDGQPILLSSPTLPIGILQTVDAQVLPLEIQAGDQLIMMSDGVYEGMSDDRAADWMEDLLTRHSKTDQEQLLKLIFEQAEKQGSNDDMSVISICISNSHSV